MNEAEDETKRIEQRGDTRTMPIGERLTFVERDAYYSRKKLDEMHADLKAHMVKEDEANKHQDNRLNTLEVGHAKVKTEVRWHRIIGSTTFSALLGWLGLK